MLKSFAILYGAALVPLLVYGLRKAGSDFNVLTFLAASRTRFVIGGLLLLIVGLLINLEPSTRDLLGLGLGGGGGTDAAIGGVIGGLCVAAIKGNEA